MLRARECIEARKLASAYATKSTYVNRKTMQIRAKREDLFDGCFDAVYIDGAGTMCFVQVTGGQSSTAVGYRKTKIRKRFIASLQCIAHTEACRRLQVELWQYIPRRGFRIWRWAWASQCWTESSDLLVPPTMRRGKRC
jgi:hypothetical protein